MLLEGLMTQRQIERMFYNKPQVFILNNKPQGFFWIKESIRLVLNVFDIFETEG